jgi:cysteine desulfurase
VAISAHKIYGPRGAGAVWLRGDLVIDAVIGGGHQERERRPGTENVVGIAGAGAAAELAASRISGDRDAAVALTARLEVGLAEIGAEIVGAAGPRVGNTTCARFAGVAADVIVCALDLEGFAISAGAACTSGRLEPSLVLSAMGYDDAASMEAVRISVGRGNTAAEIDALVAALGPIAERARTHGGWC